MKTLLILLLFSMPALLPAQVHPLGRKVMEHLHINDDSCLTQFISVTALPHKPEQALVIIPVYADRFDEGGYERYTLDGHIAIADTLSGRIWYYLHEKARDNGWASLDPEALSGIYPDMASYELAPGQHAFGIRIHFSGASKANPGSYTLLSLYLPQNGTLKKVLDRLPCHTYLGEWDTRCAGKFSTSDIRIQIAGKQSEGYCHLILKQENSITKTIPGTNGDCTEKTKISGRKKRVMRYRQGSYR